MPEKTDRTRSAMDALAEEHFAQELALDPLSATMLGLPDAGDHYPDYSPGGTQEFDDLNAATLKALDAAPVADETDEVTAAALRERLDLARELHATGRVELNNIASPAQDIRGIFDLMPTDTAEDWARISTRLSHVPEAIAGYRETLDAAANAGNLPASRQFETVVDQIASLGTSAGFFSDLASQAKAAGALSDSDLDLINTRAQEAAEAYAGLSEQLKSLHDKAPAQDAVGQDLYQLYSRQFIGSELDFAETYEWGETQLAQIVADQQAIATELGVDTVAEARAKLDADPARQLHGTDALQSWMQNLADEALSAMAAHFDIPEDINRIQAMIAPTQDGGIYYTGPSTDFSRPGRMWWSIPEGETVFSTWRETTTVYHEGVPGHHLQIGTTMTTNLNEWRRNGLWVSGHGEGWALYAEKLMEEFGFLTDPGDRLGMLDAQRMRAARVVFDIGLHCQFQAPEEWGGKTWDAETGYRFLRHHLNDSEGQLKFEWLRYLGWAGQAPSYLIGQRKWQQIRAEHEAAASRTVKKFDLKDFHTRALHLGSMGLDTLQMALSK